MTPDQRTLLGAAWVMILYAYALLWFTPRFVQHAAPEPAVVELQEGPHILRPKDFWPL